MIDLTPIINAAIALIAAALAAFVIPWLRRNTDQKDRETLLQWVDVAVAAAQQLYHTLSGPARKAYVIDFLREKGYDVDTPEVDSAIEAAVLRLHQALETQA